MLIKIPIIKTNELSKVRKSKRLKVIVFGVKFFHYIETDILIYHPHTKFVRFNGKNRDLRKKKNCSHKTTLKFPIIENWGVIIFFEIFNVSNHSNNRDFQCNFIRRNIFFRKSLLLPLKRTNLVWGWYICKCKYKICKIIKTNLTIGEFFVLQ